jgi:hypothetical protein
LSKTREELKIARGLLMGKARTRAREWSEGVKRRLLG